MCGVEFLLRSLGSSFVGIVSYRRLRVESAEASTHTGHGDESPLALLVSDDLPVSHFPFGLLFVHNRMLKGIFAELQ